MIRFLGVMLSAVLVLAPNAPVFADSAAPHPDIHVGDIWSYRKVDGFDGTVVLEFSNKVVDTSNDEITIKLSNKNVKATELQYFTKDLNSLDVSQVQFEPYWPKYDFPLSVGKAWNKDFKSRKTDGSNSSGSVHAKVVATEDVTVPAGTFSSFRIVYDSETIGTDSSASISKGNLTAWYAPAINNVVKSETVVVSNGRVRSKEVIELTEYISATDKGK